MLVTRLLLLFLFSVFRANNATGVTTEPNWGHYSQNEYDVIYERVQAIWYNHSYCRDCKVNLGFYNRTTRAVNSSGYILVDGDRHYSIHVQFLKFLSNEYRYFPITLSLNLCQQYDLNVFNVRQVLHNFTNIRSCEPKKGFYYIRNLVLDNTRGAPHMVRGSFKVVINVYHKSLNIGETDVYCTIKDKPLKWDK